MANHIFNIHTYASYQKVKIFVLLRLSSSVKRERSLIWAIFLNSLNGSIKWRLTAIYHTISQCQSLSLSSVYFSFDQWKGGEKNEFLNQFFHFVFFDPFYWFRKAFVLVKSCVWSHEVTTHSRAYSIWYVCWLITQSSIKERVDKMRREKKQMKV